MGSDALKASDSAIRWWAVMGHLMHGKDAVTAAADRLNARLKDENVSVRIAAAETLAKCGRESDLPAALDLLLAAADLRETGYFDAVRALNALDDLREQLSPAQKDRLAALPRTGPRQSQRTCDYVQRLLEHIAGKQIKIPPRWSLVWKYVHWLLACCQTPHLHLARVIVATVGPSKRLPKGGNCETCGLRLFRKSPIATTKLRSAKHR
ncbi:MAG TPA: HEAT repeat domain-containing protein [Verrucomicrobiales bacterium]|nr:HEAT repeat domain-containing protein [Verrucomicrobiales bacterium]